MNTRKLERLTNMAAFAAFFGFLGELGGGAIETIIDPPELGERPLTGIIIGLLAGLAGGAALGSWEFKNRKPRE